MAPRAPTRSLSPAEVGRQGSDFVHYSCLHPYPLHVAGVFRQGDMLGQLRLIYDILDRKERIQVGLLAMAMVVAGVTEVVGVGSVLPFMQLVSDPSILQGTGWQAEVYDRVGFSSPRAATVAAGVVLLVVIAGNNLVRAGMVWAISTWGWDLNHRLSVTLLGRYVSRPYTFFLGRNTATMNRTLLNEVGTVVSGVLIPVMATAARIVGVVLVVGLLAWVEPILAAFLGVTFGGAYALVYLGLRRGERRRGEERFEYSGDRFRIAGEVLTGIKDVKALGREEEFVRRYATPSQRFAKAAARNQVVSQVPNFMLETFALGAVVTMVLVSLQSGADVRTFLPVLSLYGFGVYRLMPNLSAIFRSLVGIRFNGPALEELHAELVGGATPTAGEPRPSRAGASSSDPPGDGVPRIEMRGLSYRYPDAVDDALHGIDMRVAPGEVVGFVGQTGAGKTTLVDVVLSLLAPTDGEILVDGVRLDEASAPEWRARCGYVPQDTFLSDDSVTANIAFGIPEDDIDQAAVEEAARIAQIHDFVRELPRGYDTIVGERGVRMSGGQRQRIGVARALYHDPDVLVLDEATSALDGVTESAVLDTIDSVARAKTVLVIAHRLTTVRSCDMIHVLDGGRIVASGPYDSLLREHEGFRAMAGELAT